MTSSHHQNSAAASIPPLNEEVASRKRAPQPKLQEPTVMCPRCDSINTKFCYYNNYSLAQPRHFCKNCRRYWTRGGTLRNIPVGGGRRKNKRMVNSSSSSCTASVFSVLSGSFNIDPSAINNIGGGFKSSHGVSGSSLNRTMINPSHGGSAYNDVRAVSCLGSESVAVSSLMGSGGFSNTVVLEYNTNVVVGSSSSVNIDANLVSSIESMSFLNQDLHRNLQQQRLAMYIGEPTVTEMKPFQSLEFNPSSRATRENVIDDGNCSRREGSVGNCTALEYPLTDWFFGNSNFSHSSSSSSSSPAAAAAVSSMAAPAVSGSGVNNGNGEPNMGNWHGFQAWDDSDLHHHHHQYDNALPLS